MPTVTAPTPQERLAASRQAIVRHMTRDGQSSQSSNSRNEHPFDETDETRASAGGRWAVAKGAMRAWWRHHPGSAAFDLARPMIGKFAQEQPFKLLGIAAGIGAAAVVLRPWRLVSLGGILLATLKSSQLSSVLLAMLNGSGQDAEHREGHYE